MVLGFLIQKAAGCAGIVMKTRSSSRGLEFEPGWIKLTYLIYLDIYLVLFTKAFFRPQLCRNEENWKEGKVKKNRPKNLCQNMIDSMF